MVSFITPAELVSFTALARVAGKGKLAAAVCPHLSFGTRRIDVPVCRRHAPSGWFAP